MVHGPSFNGPSFKARSTYGYSFTNIHPWPRATGNLRWPNVQRALVHGPSSRDARPGPRFQND
eukprot:5318445-Lingulodinium_polyedra.AAC.1